MPTQTIPLNSDQKQVVFVIGGALLLYVLIKVVLPVITAAGKVTEKVDEVIDKVSDERGEAKKEVPKTASKTGDGSTRATITPSAAARIANEQADAMNSLGTNEDKLFNTLKGLNGKDLQLIYEAFGKRKYWSFGGTQFIGYYYSLFGWYENELDSKELSKMKGVWKKAGLSWN